MQMKKLFLLIAAALFVLPQSSSAQWHAGVTVGADYNAFSREKHYMADYTFKGHGGFTFGITGQYDFNDWLGIRADLNLTQKNHQEYRELFNNVDYTVKNNYLQLPVMASFSFGGDRLRGFCNLGVYGAYWLSSNWKGSVVNIFSDLVFDIDDNMEFMSERDERWDGGFVGGIGLEYRISYDWSAQAELRHYYSLTSITKDYMQYNDPRYNSTTAFQLGVNYHF